MNQQTLYKHMLSVIEKYKRKNIRYNTGNENAGDLNGKSLTDMIKARLSEGAPSTTFKIKEMSITISLDRVVKQYIGNNLDWMIGVIDWMASADKITLEDLSFNIAHYQYLALKQKCGFTILTGQYVPVFEIEREQDVAVIKIKYLKYVDPHTSPSLKDLMVFKEIAKVNVKFRQLLIDKVFGFRRYAC